MTLALIVALGCVWYAAIAYCVKALLDVLHDSAVSHNVGVHHARWEPWLLGVCWPITLPVFGVTFARVDRKTSR